VVPEPDPEMDMISESGNTRGLYYF